MTRVRYLGPPKTTKLPWKPEHPILTRRNDHLKVGVANRYSIEALPLRAVRGSLTPRQKGGTSNDIDLQRHDCPRDADAQSVDPVAAISASSNSTKTNVTTASEIVRRG